MACHGIVSQIALYAKNSCSAIFDCFKIFQKIWRKEKTATQDYALLGGSNGTTSSRWVGKHKQLILVGDGRFATGQLTLDCVRYGVTLLSRLKINARLFDFPPEKTPGKRGRIPLKGKRLINFKQMLSLENLPWKDVEIVGYSGIKSLVRYISATCMWGADGSTPIPIRWTLIIDPTGKMNPMPLMSTDSLLSPEQMIEMYI